MPELLHHLPPTSPHVPESRAAPPEPQKTVHCAQLNEDDNNLPQSSAARMPDVYTHVTPEPVDLAKSLNKCRPTTGIYLIYIVGYGNGKSVGRRLAEGVLSFCPRAPLYPPRRSPLARTLAERFYYPHLVDGRSVTLFTEPVECVNTGGIKNEILPLLTY
ncbi:hypothetical protein J6590_001860 [Homalodisca vitripennis]|nr:hypothetical protein J6590_001860 [Homalodisca vitripennis]